MILLANSSIAGSRCHICEIILSSTLLEPQSQGLGVVERFLLELNLIKNSLLNMIQGGQQHVLYPHPQGLLIAVQTDNRQDYKTFRLKKKSN